MSEIEMLWCENTAGEEEEEGPDKRKRWPATLPHSSDTKILLRVLCRHLCGLNQDGRSGPYFVVISTTWGEYERGIEVHCPNCHRSFVAKPEKVDYPEKGHFITPVLCRCCLAEYKTDQKRGYVYTETWAFLKKYHQGFGFMCTLCNSIQRLRGEYVYNGRPNRSSGIGGISSGDY